MSAKQTDFIFYAALASRYVLTVVRLCDVLTVVKLSRFNSESRFGLSV